MKLFTRKDLIEGEAHPRNTFISYGKSLTNIEWHKTDGWYVMIEIPLTRNMLHINPNTFQQKDGPMRYFIKFRYRPANHNRGPIKHLIRGWFPV